MAPSPPPPEHSQEMLDRYDKMIKLSVMLKKLKNKGHLQSHAVDQSIKTGDFMLDQKVLRELRKDIELKGDVRPEVIAFNAIRSEVVLGQYDKQKMKEDIEMFEKEKGVAVAEQEETDVKIKELGLWKVFRRNKAEMRRRFAAKKKQILEEIEADAAAR
ncbi:hypothetical protein OHC33_011016 [Knufia fluminis]|uniref:Uncharacterized protein n=1 Tax=Knufia fluminis TaxID=191047 RepID=A0AAN8I361_9EURO|nr:hypothetical protein OHC33_011016 [Knufia fluminis]